MAGYSLVPRPSPAPGPGNEASWVWLSYEEGSESGGCSVATAEWGCRD